MELSSLTGNGPFDVHPAASSPREAAQAFEAMLLEQMVAEMRKTVPQEDDSSSSMHGLIADRVFADVMARGGGIGLADAMVRDMGLRDAGETP